MIRRLIKAGLKDGPDAIFDLSLALWDTVVSVNTPGACVGHVRVAQKRGFIKGATPLAHLHPLPLTGLNPLLKHIPWKLK